MLKFAAGRLWMNWGSPRYGMGWPAAYDVDNFVVICVFYFLTFSKKYDIIYIEKMRKERK